MFCAIFIFQTRSRGEQQIYKNAQFGADKLGADRALSDKFGIGERGME